MSSPSASAFAATSSTWFEAYLDGQWWAFDARNNTPRVGRVLMATGRDAADVAFLTSFGGSTMTNFFVVSEEELPSEPQPAS
jgi:transglutaminase-like putative cysteine protease